MSAANSQAPSTENEFGSGQKSAEVNGEQDISPETLRQRLAQHAINPKKATTAKFDKRILDKSTPLTKSKVEREAEAASLSDDAAPRLNPLLVYFLIFVLFGSTVFGIIQTMQAGPVF
jgi:hypothetical protein